MEQKLEMFRNVIESSNNDTDADFENAVNADIFSDLIYTYTPKGDVVELPIGSTPVDFAYRIHSRVGDTTVGAIVNDQIVPLSYELKTMMLLILKQIIIVHRIKTGFHLLKLIKQETKLRLSSVNKTKKNIF